MEGGFLIIIRLKSLYIFTFKGNVRYISMKCICNVQIMSKKGVIYVYEMKRRKGNGYVTQTYELNRIDYMILESLYVGGCKDRFHGMTITEISDDYEGSLGKRTTVWKKMQKLVSNGYLAKGILDDHADTYYLLDKSIKIIEELKEEKKNEFEREM